MKRPTSATDNDHDAWENDAVCDLLKQAPAPAASGSFADDTVRQARLADAPRSWWQGLCTRGPVVGFAAATAAIIMLLGYFTITQRQATQAAIASSTIEEIAETEMLLAAVDHLDDFTDTELAALIGF